MTYANEISGLESFKEPNARIEKGSLPFVEPRASMFGSMRSLLLPHKVDRHHLEG